MANTGNVFPGTGESVDRAGLTAWTGPGNVVSDNATDATCNATGSDYLVARNFGFTIPAGATINGILVRVEASEHSGGTEPLLAQLQDASAALTGNSKSTSNEGSISGTTKAVYTYGGTADAWGATLTDTVVNNANFGVRLWFTTAHDVRVDYVTLAVEYTPAATFKDAAVSFAGAGTASTGWQRLRNRVAAFTGAGTLTTAFQRVRVRAASWIGAGTFTVTPESPGPTYKDAAVAFTGAGTSSTAWQRLRNRVAAWVGGSAFATATQRVRLRQAAFTGAGTFSAVPEGPAAPANGNGYSPGCRPIRVRHLPTSRSRRNLTHGISVHRW